MNIGQRGGGTAAAVGLCGAGRGRGRKGVGSVSAEDGMPCGVGVWKKKGCLVFSESLDMEGFSASPPSKNKK